MIIITNDEWVADLRTMTCRNIITGMVFEFKKNETTYTGKLTEMPFELLRQWIQKEQGEKFIKKAVIEAEKVLRIAQIESNIENNKKRNTICYRQ